MNEQRTDSGILLPDRRPEGHPVVVMYLDVPGVTITVAGDTNDDLEAIAANVISAQARRLAAGETASLTLAEPAHGDPLIVTPVGLHHVAFITRGYMQHVDPVSAMRRRNITNPPPPLQLPRPPGGN